MSMEYLGGFHYQGTALKFFPTAEGYVQATALKVGFAYSYVYNYTDHLGNIRLSYAQDPENPNVLKIIEESHYYPFGLKHANYNSDQLAFKEKDPGPGLMLMAAAAAIDPVPQFVYNYKYNGKEFQDEMGMNWYDYGARNYDPAIGRWMNIDPKAETSRRWSPYTYCYDNPIIFVDPDGMLPTRSGDPVGPGYYTASSNTRMVGFALRHPQAAVSIGIVSHGSTNISTNSARFAINTGLPENKDMEGSHINAFRHTLWQAKITTDFGFNTAKEAGNTHEANPTANLSQTNFKTLSEADQTIDLLNNIIGRDIGKSNPDASMKELAIETLNYFNDNGLYTADKQSDGTYSVVQTKLTPEQYSSALETIITTNNNGYTPSQQVERTAELKKQSEIQDKENKGNKF